MPRIIDLPKQIPNGSNPILDGRFKKASRSGRLPSTIVESVYATIIPPLKNRIDPSGLESSRTDDAVVLGPKESERLRRSGSVRPKASGIGVGSVVDRVRIILDDSTSKLSII